jgi:hypothetical protein
MKAWTAIAPDGRKEGKTDANPVKQFPPAAGQFRFGLAARAPGDGAYLDETSEWAAMFLACWIC